MVDKKFKLMDTINNEVLFITIIREYKEGYIYEIRNTSEKEEKTRKEYMTKEMFESCIKTGYLIEDWDTNC